MILNSPTISGSLTVTGNIITSGSITISGSIASASYATNAELLDGLDSTAFATTGAYSATSASLYATSASLSATSGSLSATSGSLSATSGSLSATSGSLSTASGSFDTRVATIESKYATTGSNTFTSTQVVSGSILQSGSFTTTGTIIAQTINVQTVTSSVVYSSGSNVFGNSIGNSQTFTGSVLITGSLTIAGASSATSYNGATIYGSTVACSPIGLFSGCVGIGTANPSAKLHINGGRTLAITGNENYSLGIGRESNTNAYYLGVHSTSSPNLLFSNNAGTTNMTLDYSGNLGLGVTPSAWSLVVAAQVLNSGFYGYSSNVGGIAVNTYYSSGWKYMTSSVASTRYELSNGSHIFYSATGGTAGTAATESTLLTIASTGAACFANNVCSPNFIASSTCSTAGLRVYGASGTHQWDMYLNGANLRFSDNTSGGFFIVDTAATFSGQLCSITGVFGSKGGGNYGILISDNDQSNVRLRFTNTGGGNTWDLIGGLNAANNNDFSIRDVTNCINALRIVPVTGEATFNSSVIASGFYAVAGNSARFYRGTNDYYWRIHNDASNNLNFGTYASSETPYGTNPKMILIDNGNVGIGTCVPSQQLSFGMLTNSATRTYTTDNQGTLSFYNLTTGNLEAYLDIASVRTGNDSTLGGANIRFLTQTVCSTTSACERMRITSGGNVGIGTASPVTANLVGSTTIVKSYNGDTPTSTTAQTYYINQSNLYLFGRNAGLTMVGNANEESVIAFGNPYAYYVGGIRMGMGSGVAGGDMVFQTCGVCERMRITSGGNIGIGTNSPAAALNVSCVPSSYFGIIETTGTSTGTVKHFRVHKPNCVEYGIGILDTNSFHISTASTFPTANGFTLTSAGNIGMGISTPFNKLTVNTGTGNNLDIFDTGTSYGIGMQAVNGNNTAYKTWDFYATKFNFLSGNLYFFNYAAGTLSVNSSNQVISSSDKNLKTDDGGIDNALSKVLRLNPRYFHWKEDSGIEDTNRQLGFYAQDVQEALGVEVASKSSNDKWGIYDRGIIAMLTKAIQELKAENDIFKTCLGIS